MVYKQLLKKIRPTCVIFKFGSALNPQTNSIGIHISNYPSELSGHFLVNRSILKNQENKFTYRKQNKEKNNEPFDTINFKFKLQRQL